MQNKTEDVYQVFYSKDNYISVVKNGLIKQFKKGNPDYDKAVALFEADDIVGLANIVHPLKVIVTELDGDLTFVDNKLYYKGMELTNYVTDRIIDYRRNKQDYTGLVKFLERVLLNPYKEARDSVLKFIEIGNLPICSETGFFYAYKGVGLDYMSLWHSAVRYQHLPGSVIHQDFNDCENTPLEACGKGLHCGTFDYASNYGRNGRLLLVAVDPAAVVSVPSDSSQGKIRTWWYYVVKELNPFDGPIQERFTTQEVIALSNRDSKGRFIKNSAIKPLRDSKGHFIKTPKITKLMDVEDVVKFMNVVITLPEPVANITHTVQVDNTQVIVNTVEVNKNRGLVVRLFNFLTGRR